jgi:hypothetical protein
MGDTGPKTVDRMSKGEEISDSKRITNSHYSVLLCISEIVHHLKNIFLQKE